MMNHLDVLGVSVTWVVGHVYWLRGESSVVAGGIMSWFDCDEIGFGFILLIDSLEILESKSLCDSSADETLHVETNDIFIGVREDVGTILWANLWKDSNSKLLLPQWIHQHLQLLSCIGIRWSEVEESIHHLSSSRSYLIETIIRDVTQGYQHLGCQTSHLYMVPIIIIAQVVNQFVKFFVNLFNCWWILWRMVFRGVV
jgi:hypothetical protein